MRICIDCGHFNLPKSIKSSFLLFSATAYLILANNQAAES